MTHFLNIVPTRISRGGTRVLLIIAAMLEIVALIAVVYLTVSLTDTSLSLDVLHKTCTGILVGSPEILMFIGFYRALTQKDNWWGKTLAVITTCMLLISGLTLFLATKVLTFDALGINILTAIRCTLVMSFNVCVHVPHIQAIVLQMEGADIQTDTPDITVSVVPPLDIPGLPSPDTSDTPDVHTDIQTDTPDIQTDTPDITDDQKNRTSYVSIDDAVILHGYSKDYLRKRIRSGKMATHPDNPQLIDVSGLSRK